MTARPWYTPSGAALRALAWTMKTAGVEADMVLFFGALVYGLTDVFGLSTAIRILWSLKKKSKGG